MDILEYGNEPLAHDKEKKGQFVEDPSVYYG